MATSDNIADTMVFVAPTAGVTAGTMIKIQDTVVLPMKTAAATVSFPGKFKGLIADAPKVGSQAWAVGQKCYWDNGNARFTTASTGNTLRGITASVVGSGAGATTGDVWLLQTPA